MSLSFYDIVPEVLIDKVHRYAGRCVNCGELCSGDIVPELGEYYCYKECGPEYNHFSDDFYYNPFNGFDWMKNHNRLSDVFFSYLKTHYLYGRLEFSLSITHIKIYGINHYEFDYIWDYEQRDENKSSDKNVELNTSRLIVDIMKNTLELPEPCCTNGRVIGNNKKWCKCPYGLSYRLNNYFEFRDVKPLKYVKYIKDPYILKILRHLYENSSGETENDVIFVPNSCENYTLFFTRTTFGKKLDYKEKIDTKYGSFIVVDGKTEYTDIASLFRKKSDSKADTLSSLKAVPIVNYVNSMRSPIVMRFKNSSFNEDMLRILQKALEKDENKFWGIYIAIIPKKFLESSKILIESMIEEHQNDPFEYIETKEAFFFSQHITRFSR